MPGLIAQKMQPQAAPGEQPQGSAVMNVKRVVIAAVKVVHSPQVTQGLLQIMKSSGQPPKALAKAALMVLAQLYEKSGKSIPPKTMSQALYYIIHEIAMLAQKAGIFKADEAIIKQAIQMAVKATQAKQAPPTAPAVTAPPVAPPAAAPMMPQGA